MTQTTILLFTLGMLAGLPAGYWIAWAVDDAMRILTSALSGQVWIEFVMLDVMERA